MNYAILFLPFVVSYLAQDSPIVAYWIAWSGSILILIASLSGWVTPLPGYKSYRTQLFRPIVFTQVVFAGYTALSSVFYFLAVATHANAGHLVAQQQLRLIATAQSYYVLGHAAMVVGILAFMRYRDSGRFVLARHHTAYGILFGLSASFLIMSLLALRFPEIQQITVRLRSVAMVTSVFGFALSLAYRQGTRVTVNATIFAINFILALLGGWKEDVLILLLLLVTAIFPVYRRLSIVLGLVVIPAFMLFMPAYNIIYRNLTWYGTVAPSQALMIAFNQVASGKVSLGEASSNFARDRLSEMNHFVKYLERVPDQHPYYGSTIIKQTAENFVPRVVWPGKPNAERVVMERAYENNVVSRLARISAKPQYVVDCYLWWGIPGIVIGCLIFGALASLMSRVAERWFNGYTLGSGLIYAALFQIFWRGNSFEFFFPTVFWSFIGMVLLFFAGRRFGLLVERASLDDAEAASEVRPGIPRWQQRLKTPDRGVAMPQIR
jgi:hypothetical protein